MLEKENAPLIYFDCAATTRCTDEVARVMFEFNHTHFGNASSPHIMGRRTMAAVNKSVESISQLIGCSGRELTLTSGATESNNIVILGSTCTEKGKNIVICPIDHKSSLEAANEMARRGIEVRSMTVDQYGRINLEHLTNIVDVNTALVTLSYVNSEIGTLQNLEEIETVLCRSSALFHVDASQAVGKVEVNVRDSRIDCLSLSAHKIGGPQGIGALYVRESIAHRIKPLTFGGGQDKLRSGTLPSQLIVGFASAADLLKKRSIKILWEEAKIRQSIILQALQRYELTYLLNSSLNYSVPHIMNVSFPGVRSETIINGLPNVCVASGSACNSKNMKPSYVLTGVGHSDDRANCAIRISFTADMDINQVYLGAEILAKKVRSLQALVAWKKMEDT